MGTRMLRVGEHLAWMAETPERIITDGDADGMQAHLDQHGYILVRGLIDPDAVRAGCRRLAEMLAENGWLAPGAAPEELVVGEAPPGGGFMLQAEEQDAMMDAPEVRRVLAGPELMGLFGALFSEPAATFDFKWWRAFCPGQSSGFHSAPPHTPPPTPPLLLLF